MSGKVDALLDFWLKHKMNVMLEGIAGFGKTHMVIDTFNRHNLNWKYFSASTMDPWVDFIGVPKEVDDGKGNKFLDLIRPREFQNDEVEAIFFDEFNRAPKKVRNAVMELIQFKSINGKKFNNLKVVWCAINPHDEEETYDVEKLDPAQIDRFHVRFAVPNQPDAKWFADKYGKDIAVAACDWWHGIPKEFRVHVSARRLQYIIDCYLAGGDISYLVHPKTNPSKLLMTLSSGSVLEKLKDILSKQDGVAMRDFLKKENNFDIAVDYLKNNVNVLAGIMPYIDEERQMRIAAEIPSVMKYVTKDENVEAFAGMLRALLNAGTLDANEEKRIRAILSRRVSLSADGVTRFFEPTSYIELGVPLSLIKTEIKNRVITSLVHNAADREEIYTYLKTNLQRPDSVPMALDVMCLLFRIIEGEKEEKLCTKYTLIMPMMNLVLDYLHVEGVDFNSDAVVTLFKQGNREISKPLKVQGYIDSNVNLLANKRNKPRIF